MKLSNLIKVKTSAKKRLGRGLGSGKGKTSGRGTKGQKARGKIPQTFTGNLALYKKLPLRRGKGNVSITAKPKIIKLDKLSVFKARTVVDIIKLLEEKIVLEKDIKNGVKILGVGEITNALIVRLPVSKNARQQIEKAGGKVENV